MTLHIYAQCFEHDEAYIVGTREDMQQLRDALDRALASNASSEQFFTSDGEGYSLHIQVVPESIETTLCLPYALVDRGLGRDEYLPWAVQ
jgi:hypothetical protein